MPARSTAPTCLVTGGSGLLGSHIAEKLVGKGARVRALVRQGSARGFLEDLGAEIVTGDLTDQACCEKAVRGVDFVYHAAAKVGDWGPWSEFQSGCVDATANLALAAKKEGIKRFVHISSTSAYGHPREGGPAIEESAELGQNLWWAWDYYTRSKVECERLLWTLAKDGLPLTVIRPSWLYGERDRTTVARLVERFRGNGVPVIGRGENPLSAIYAGCVADAAILAAEHPRAVGEAYNITDQGPITQREYLNLWADACGMPPVGSRRRYPIIFAVAFLLEAAGRLTRRERPPLISRYATWLMARELAYSTEKARSQLGWEPGLSYRESIERTVRWYDARKRPAAQSAVVAQSA